MKIMKKKSVTITLDQMADFLLVLSIFLFAYRGNLGGIIAIISLIVRILKGKFVKTNANKVLLFWILYLLVFPICIYIISNKNFEFYAFMGYILSLSILIFANELDYERIFKYIYVGAIFIAASVLLQFLLPGIFDSIAKIIMPSNVYISVINRNSTGYVTGLTREVSYAALFLFIGLLYSIFIKKNRVISFVWLGILFLTGKKAQPIFAIIAICIVLYSQTKNLKKHLKILCGIIAGVFAIVVSFPVWKNISFLERLVTFVENIKNGSDIIGLTSGRTVIYERAIELWSQNKWFGIGWENFRNIGAYGSSEYTTWFGKLFGGWGLYEDGQFTTESIENFMLFVPFSILLLWAFQKELLGESENIRFGKTVWEATKVVAIFSFMIEFTQLLFHLGTFQISDLTYNTLGGAVGGVIYYLGYSRRRKK